MTTKEQFLSGRRRYQPITLAREFTDEEMVRDWTLSEADQIEVSKYNKRSRLFVAIQLCTVRLYGRFLQDVHDLSSRILNYLNKQLDLPPSLTVQVPDREATYLKQRKNILHYLGFKKFDGSAHEQLHQWLVEKANQGVLPYQLFNQAEQYLLTHQILLPGPTVVERLIIHVASEVHHHLYETMYQRLSPELRISIDRLLTVSDGEKQTLFYQLKEYPPSATISSLKKFLNRYQSLTTLDLDTLTLQLIDSAFQDYLFKLTKKYSAKELKRFHDAKRYALMICFLLETRSVLLDHLVNMHDQYMMEITRVTKNKYEKQYRQFRKRQKRAVNVMLHLSQYVLDWPREEPMLMDNLWQEVNRTKVQTSIEDFRALKQLNERGYADILLARYPSLRKYFADFLHLPFEAALGSAHLIEAIQLLRQIDVGQLKRLPKDAPTSFVPKELRPVLIDDKGQLNRNAWEMGLALAIKDALRSGDLYLSQSRQHVSFWNFMLNDLKWQEVKASSYIELEKPYPTEVVDVLTKQFNEAVSSSQQQFPHDNFARIQKGVLKLKRDDKAPVPASVPHLQQTVSSSLPFIRIEQLLIEVDQQTQFSRHFVPIQNHHARPKLFYKTLLSALLAQATNLGVVSMSNSVKDVSVDMIRHVQKFFIREETIQAANKAIVDKHHQLPLSHIHGDGSISSSDGQLFAIRASSLLASYYPRYYGYYKKAIGIYTHVSDQYSVFGTKVISCAPREALFVLDGLLENNTILSPKKHTTDTHGYTEIIFALCYMLGYYFMPRIRDLKDQQLYCLDKSANYGVFTSLLTKSIDLHIVVEQWDEMMRVAFSLKNRTAPAHLIVQRLTNSYPSDRLSKAFTNLGRLIKTQYILRYLTDPPLRAAVQRQLNKGEYRHKLPRRVFFADQGEFTVGDYEEIMNKASCLSLICNAALYWNTIEMDKIIQQLRLRGEVISDEALSHVSLLPYRHILPNGTYFIDDF